MTKRIGILTCRNTKDEACCSSFGCLDALKKMEGSFEAYKDNGGVELAGLISCTGCPTAAAPEKVLRQVRTLVASGVEAVHLSTCMTVLCPFRLKYVKAIKQKYPQLEVVEATHTADKKIKEMFVGFMQGVLTQPRQTMADMIEMEAKARKQQA
jgi:predicted metal-binding protein